MAKKFSTRFGNGRIQPTVGKSGLEQPYLNTAVVELVEALHSFLKNSPRMAYLAMMASRLVEGLYFGVEVMDIDAETGGYNLQAAFSTGYLAGESAATYIRETKGLHS